MKMKNTILLFAIAIVTISQSFAQDRLFFLNGDEQDVKITEVSSSEVKYKRINNLEGPTFSTLKTELFMVKYANGEKEMMSTQSAESAPEAAYTTSESVENSNTKNGLSSSVVVSDKPTYDSAPLTDKWGRTEAENRAMKKKKVKVGAVLLGVGTVVAGSGAALIAIDASNGGGGSSTVGQNTGRPRSFSTLALGMIFTAGGTAMLISGAVILGTSGKYIKRANQLANGNASLAPSIINIHSYSGTSINSQAGYGLTLNYKF